MPIYDDQILREALIKAEDNLDYCIKEVVAVLRKSFPPDARQLTFIIRVAGYVDGELELTYGFADHSYDYTPDVKGKQVHVALLEYLRRKGYEHDSTKQIIPALLSPPSEDPDDIPF
jgi:hypothetical protein